MPQHPALARAAAFCDQFNLRVPILMAPMASACPPSLAIAIANAGGLGGCGAVMMQPDAIKKWASDVRAGTNGGFQFNLWIPDPPPKRDAAAEAAVRDFLANWGPPVPPEAGNLVLPNFQAQCDALLEASPVIVSSIMGLYPDRFVRQMKTKSVKWFATVTTVPKAWADAIGKAAPEDTIITRTLTGRPARSIPPNLCALRWLRRRHRRPPIRCNAGSLSPCATRPPKRTMSPGCRLGLVSRPGWREQNPPAKSFNACGKKPKLYWASCYFVDPGGKSCLRRRTEAAFIGADVSLRRRL